MIFVISMDGFRRVGTGDQSRGPSVAEDGPGHGSSRQAIVRGRRPSCKGGRWVGFARLQCLASRAPARHNDTGRDRAVRALPGWTELVVDDFRHFPEILHMPRTVLIVDDERDTNDILAAMAQARHFEPV